jgi:hypothetical protein
VRGALGRLKPDTIDASRLARSEKLLFVREWLG